MKVASKATKKEKAASSMLAVFRDAACCMLHAACCMLLGWLHPAAKLHPNNSMLLGWLDATILQQSCIPKKATTATATAISTAEQSVRGSRLQQSRARRKQRKEKGGKKKKGIQQSFEWRSKKLCKDATKQNKNSKKAKST